MEKLNAWDKLTPAQQQQAHQFATGYRNFLTQAKTERQAVKLVIEAVREHGFQPLEAFSRLQQGDKVYQSIYGKALCLAVVGEHPIEQGFRIVGSHMDAPRLDLKPNPIYEESGLVFAKTHYYGGVKKYQWAAVPLALHGIVITAEGKTVNISLGEGADEPVFTITDLLPHLAKDQLDKKIREALKGEDLNILVASVPVGAQNVKARVKANLLEILHKQYGITEEDFVSAELEAVPAGAARQVGFDKGLIGGYGQDDRACVYTSLQALFDINHPKMTSIALFADKEETGSAGSTGMKSNLLEDFVSELNALMGNKFEQLSVRRALRRSKALSADGTVGFDPNFPDVVDKYNTASLGGGVVISKYSGVGGKNDTSDASAEFVGEVRRIFNQANIAWQSGELGKVDQGGGGTIAQYMARYGMEVVDCGPAMLSLHSPFELTSVVDIYSCYRAYREFFNY
ncbi:MAG: aminopeptidase [Peptococcaceae bacterium]|nr:aminopeptidase [Peptococcaceae bacterium]